MTYTLEAMTMWNNELLYKGPDHKAALAAARTALNNQNDDDEIVCTLTCLSLPEDLTWDLRITDGAITRINL